MKYEGKIIAHNFDIGEFLVLSADYEKKEVVCIEKIMHPTNKLHLQPYKRTYGFGEIRIVN